MYCFKCGVSGDKVKLFDAISGKGVVKICKECSFEEDVVFIKKKEKEPQNKFEKQLIFHPEKSKIRQTVYERLSRMSGIDLKDKKSEEKEDLLKKQETTLKDIVDKNFNMNVSTGLEKGLDLVNNFHWVIMRARRLKHLTQKQLAKEIAEPEAAIKMAEQGVLKDYKLINKLENYLGIKLVKKEINSSVSFKEKEKMVLDFDPITAKNLTISDLQEMKKKKESGILEKDKGEISGTEEIEDTGLVQEK